MEKTKIDNRKFGKKGGEEVPQEGRGRSEKWQTVRARKSEVCLSRERASERARERERERKIQREEVGWAG